MRLCLMSLRRFTGRRILDHDETCILEHGHDGDHDFVPDPIAVECAELRRELPGLPDLEATLDPPTWVGFTVNLTEAMT